MKFHAGTALADLRDMGGGIALSVSAKNEMSHFESVFGIILRYRVMEVDADCAAALLATC